MNTTTPSLDIARRLRLDGRLEEAFKVFASLLDTAPDQAAVRSEFGTFLFHHLPPQPHPLIDRALTRALKECWIRPELPAARVIQYLAVKWPAPFAPNAPDAAIDDLLSDPLALALLQATTMATTQFERILARFRRSALIAATQGHSLGRQLLSAAALAIRSWHSGYALVTPQDTGDWKEEEALAASLRAELPSRSGAALIEAIAVHACYANPDEAALARAVAGGDRIAQALDLRIASRRRRQLTLQCEIRPVTSFDPTSMIVAEQYAQHPYPAWAGTPSAQSALPAPVLAAVDPTGMVPVTSVLVAGCGTGQTTLTAARRWPKAQILGVDLSPTSLAYAMDCARDLEESRVQFVQGDLLRLTELDRRFQVIEVTGVLHHLDDPEAGLAALTEVLEPGGVMYLALYSRKARRNLAAIRETYGKSSADTDDEIKAFRAWAISNVDAPEVLYSPDFYSVGGCRDLIFHVREKAYSLPEISSMVARAGLRPLMLNLPPAADKLLSHAPALTDLAGWDAVEQQHPNIFAGMYGLWLQKPR